MPAANPSDNQQPTTDNSFIPAAGTFEGWPKTLAEFTMLDPCCGSGHFLVAAFNLLVRLRMHDEGLSAAEAGDAVLRDNLFALELDPRCTQIAAFALALAAWKDCRANGYRVLPTLNIACTGIGPNATEEEWLHLADRAGMDRRTEVLAGDMIRDHLRHLHRTFSQAPTLGSLLDPTKSAGDLFSVDFDTLKPYLQAALTAEQDQDAHERAVAAAGIVKAAELLASSYTLVITNVPYLGRGKQADELKDYIETHYAIAKADLATAMVLRCLELCAEGGSTALVTPQNWLFLTSYKKLREELLKRRQWNVVARLGPNAFQDMNWWAATTALLVLTAASAAPDQNLLGVDVSTNNDQTAKAWMLRGQLEARYVLIKQISQLSNPDSAIQLVENDGQSLLSEHADCYQGISTGDNPRFISAFWEVAFPGTHTFLQSAPEKHEAFGGCEFAVRTGLLESSYEQGTIRGRTAWGRQGLALSQTGRLRCVRYLGKVFTNITPVLVPKNDAHLPAIWAFAESGEFEKRIRDSNQKVSIDNGYVTKVPFDLAHWQAVAAEKYASGLPEPHSDDPTQWLFKGDILTSTAPLQVAVARLLGYRWPEQPAEADTIDLADKDGILCLQSLRGEASGAERLLAVLRTAVGQAFQPDGSARNRSSNPTGGDSHSNGDRPGESEQQAGQGDPVRLESLTYRLLTEAGCKAGTTIEDWLRNQFFEQHCRLFHNRPFIWHIWDGRKDGFSALVNYHKLDHVRLESLTYAYLQDWITFQQKSDKTGADLRLAAAQELQRKLKLILAGEPPYDIFVRWKPLHEQAIGWHPDLNDGVRMNIRPFMLADVLRKAPNIKWTKDRGKEPERPQADFPWFWNGTTFNGDRVNDVHLTIAEKQAARRRSGFPA